VNVTNFGQTVKVVFPQCGSPDHLATPSLKKFLLKFGERAMHIYDAIISEKRILFNGGLEYSADEIQEYVLACGVLAQPLVGVLSKLYPYAPLSLLDFMDETWTMGRQSFKMGYIAGVTNPIIKERTNWYDICCEIDKGKLLQRGKDSLPYEQEKYYQLDMEFIRAIINKLRSN